MLHKLSFTILLACLLLQAKSQLVITYDKGNGKFSVNLPDGWPRLINYQTEQINEKDKATAVFVEFGDGSFTFNFKGTHKLLTRPDGSDEFVILVKATGIYDTIHRPKRIVGKSIKDVIGVSRNVNIPDLLLSSENLMLTPNVRSVVPEDDMIFAVTYKPQDAGKIQFIYDPKVFSILEDGSSAIYEDIKVKSIRTYNKEIINSEKYGDQWVIIFDNNQSNINNKERNIFLSLKPLDSASISAKGTTVITLKLLDKLGVEKESYETRLPIGSAHDPNWLKIRNMPCFHFRNNSTAKIQEKEIPYRLHFENTGIGTVKNCTAEIKLPPNADRVHVRIDSIVIGGKKASFSDVVLSASGELSNGSNGFPVTTYSYNSLGRLLKLTFLPPTTPGVDYILEGKTKESAFKKRNQCDIYYSISTTSIVPVRENTGIANSSLGSPSPYIFLIKSSAKIFFDGDTIGLRTNISKLSHLCPTTLAGGIHGSD